ncbi:MAG: protein phosphatase 2C domain-containing protein [Anaerolineaceae bacterium]|nr:protein phosphatase 2C domain-containing protein [Anaerolineaceae bacterium]
MREKIMLEIGHALDVGLMRKGKENQDALIVLHSKGFNRKPPLLIVADGMGGYNGGALASKLVIDTMTRHYQKAKRDENPIDVLFMGVLSAHSVIMRRAMQEPQLQKMGSTVVAAVIDGDMLSLVNVGDSHAYIVNENEIQQINWDHSLVADELRSGNITQEEVRNYPQKNILTMSLSAQRPEIEPSTLTRKLEPGDHVVLCSDGLWGPVTDSQIQAVVLELQAQRAADKLVEMANANQGPDNISVIVAKRSNTTQTSAETAQFNTIAQSRNDETRPISLK